MEKYEVKNRIGEGSYGTVHLVVRKKDGRTMVVKKINFGNVGTKERRMVRVEVQLLQRLQHPGIVQYIESFTEKKFGKTQMCVVMDYCEGGDLARLVKSKRGTFMTEREVMNIFCEVCLAIHFMHERNIIHRDLKAQNIFIKNKKFKVGDFGISKVLENSMGFAQTVIGTPYYMSPEVFKHRPYNLKTDVWALGCILYELCTYKHAFDARNLNGLCNKIVRGNYQPVSETKYSKHLRNLLSRMLSTAPANRPSLSQILKKPFIKKRLREYVAHILTDGKGQDAERRQGIQNLKRQLKGLGFDDMLVDVAEVEQQRVEQETLKENLKEHQRKLNEEEKANKRMEDALEKLREERKLRQKRRLNRLHLRDPKRRDKTPKTTPTAGGAERKSPMRDRQEKALAAAEKRRQAKIAETERITRKLSQQQKNAQNAEKRRMEIENQKRQKARRRQKDYLGIKNADRKSVAGRGRRRSITPEIVPSVRVPVATGISRPARPRSCPPSPQNRLIRPQNRAVNRASRRETRSPGPDKQPKRRPNRSSVAQPRSSGPPNRSPNRSSNRSPNRSPNRSANTKIRSPNRSPNRYPNTKIRSPTAESRSPGPRTRSPKPGKQPINKFPMKPIVQPPISPPSDPLVLQPAPPEQTSPTCEVSAPPKMSPKMPPKMSPINTPLIDLDKSVKEVIPRGKQLRRTPRANQKFVKMTFDQELLQKQKLEEQQLQEVKEARERLQAQLDEIDAHIKRAKMRREKETAAKHVKKDPAILRQEKQQQHQQQHLQMENAKLEGLSHQERLRLRKIQQADARKAELSKATEEGLRYRRHAEARFQNQYNTSDSQIISQLDKPQKAHSFQREIWSSQDDDDNDGNDGNGDNGDNGLADAEEEEEGEEEGEEEEEGGEESSLELASLEAHFKEHTKNVQNLRKCVDTTVAQINEKEIIEEELNCESDDLEGSEENENEDEEEGIEGSDTENEIPVGNLIERITLIKAKCERHLGAIVFDKAYNFMKDLKHNNYDHEFEEEGLNDELALQKLCDIVGNEKLRYCELIDQLLFLEENCVEEED